MTIPITVTKRVQKLSVQLVKVGSWQQIKVGLSQQIQKWIKNFRFRYCCDKKLSIKECDIYKKVIISVSINDVIGSSHKTLQYWWQNNYSPS